MPKRTPGTVVTNPAEQLGQITRVLSILAFVLSVRATIAGPLKFN